MEYLMLQDLADRWGISYNAIVQRRHQGTLPEPDIMLGRTPAWLEPTIIAHEEDMSEQASHD